MTDPLAGSFTPPEESTPAMRNSRVIAGPATPTENKTRPPPPTVATPAGQYSPTMVPERAQLVPPTHAAAGRVEALRHHGTREPAPSDNAGGRARDS